MLCEYRLQSSKRRLKRIWWLCRSSVLQQRSEPLRRTPSSSGTDGLGWVDMHACWQPRCERKWRDNECWKLRMQRYAGMNAFDGRCYCCCCCSFFLLVPSFLLTCSLAHLFLAK
jgi:hypothetical protein